MTTATPLSIASYNLGNAHDPSVVHDLTQLAKVASSIGLQEAGDRLQALHAFLHLHPTWEQYAGDNQRGQRHTPIVFDAQRLRLDRSEALEVAGPTRVAPGQHGRGAGPAVIEAKWVMRNRYEDTATGHRVHHVNTHFIASWTRGANSLGTQEWRARRAHGMRSVDVLSQMIETHPKGLMFVTGDFNATRDFALLQPLWKRIVPGKLVGGTHGNRAIDYVAYREDSRIKAGAWQVLDHFSSDHRPVVGTFQLTH